MKTGRPERKAPTRTRYSVGFVCHRATHSTAVEVITEHDFEVCISCWNCKRHCGCEEPELRRYAGWPNKRRGKGDGEQLQLC